MGQSITKTKQKKIERALLENCDVRVNKDNTHATEKPPEIRTWNLLSRLWCIYLQHEPCLGEGCIVLASPWPYACGRLQRDDIVIAKNPRCPQESVCKRIKGIPGDKIALPGTSNSPINRKAVPAGHVWIEGDNKTTSVDSRDYGPIPMGLLQGKVVLRVYPNWQSV